MPFVIGVIGTGGNPDSDDPFREAMAAPASMPEFQGTVTAVRTAEYFDEKLGSLVDRGWRWQRPGWDPEKKYVELAAKLAPIQKALNEAKAIADQAERAAKQKELNDRIQKITYTEDEIAYLAANRCNQGYHYFGSAKMLGRFGEAFAKAMIAMEKP
jgi:alpha-galactosidase